MQSVHSTTSADWATGHSLGEFFPSSEIQSVHSTDPADWVRKQWFYFVGQISSTIYVLRSYILLFSFLAISLTFSHIRFFISSHKCSHTNVYINTSYVQKVSRLKLYIPRQKWTINETLIFFKLYIVSKKYCDWSCINQDKKKQQKTKQNKTKQQGRKRRFSLKNNFP